MNPCWTNGMSTLYQADARAIPLPDKSVHCVQLGRRSVGLDLNTEYLDLASKRIGKGSFAFPGRKGSA